MRHWDWQTANSLRIPIPRQFPVPPPAIGVTCFRTTMSCSFLAISSGICHQAEGWGPCAPQGWHIIRSSMCVVCVCINVKCSPVLFLSFSQVSEKTQPFWHINITIMFTKLRSVLECPPQRSTKRFFDVETNQRDVFHKKAPFRFPTSGVRFLPSVAPYPSLPITTKTGKFICWLPRS